MLVRSLYIEHIIMANLPSDGLFSPYSLKDERRRTFPSAVRRLFRSPERKKKERLFTSHFMVKMFGFKEKRIILAGVYQVNQSPEQILPLCNQHHPQPSLFPPVF